MRLGRRTRQAEEAQIDLTSMLDIVFIMLIFFIVTSSFIRESGVDVNRPHASHATKQEEVGLFIAINAANQIFIDKHQVDIERIQARLEPLLLDNPNRSLVIQADERAYNGTVVKVMDAAKRAGVTSIALAAEQP
jgi:biopolymer transport protein ExbD